MFLSTTPTAMMKTANNFFRRFEIVSVILSFCWQICWRPWLQEWIKFESFNPLANVGCLSVKVQSVKTSMVLFLSTMFSKVSSHLVNRGGSQLHIVDSDGPIRRWGFLRLFVIPSVECDLQSKNWESFLLFVWNQIKPEQIPFFNSKFMLALLEDFFVTHLRPAILVAIMISLKSFPWLLLLILIIQLGNGISPYCSPPPHK